MNDKQRKILASKNITFACFKMVVSALLTPNDITEDQWVNYYEDFADQVENREWIEKSESPIEEFANEYFMYWDTENMGCQLRSKENSWISADIKPDYNVGVLVFIPDEDNHITAGMWDISNKWTLLDEYRDPNGEVTYWRRMPNDPV